MSPTRQIFTDDAYASTCDALVIGINDQGGIILDQTVFFATGGGQPGDNGMLERQDGSQINIATAVRERDDKETIVHVPAEGETLPEIGERLVVHIDWDRRYRLSRMHTACHLLSVVCPFPVTGAAVGEQESRLDFDMTETADKAALTEKMMDIVHANHPVYTNWITQEELDRNPDLVRSKNVKPPRGAGRIRLVCIGDDANIDSQPCGGTHVTETKEIGDIHIGKVEKKGRENRRMRIRFGPPPQT